MIQDLDATYRKSAGLDVSEVPDGFIIYDHARGQVHVLNFTAASVLDLCDGRAPLREICETLQAAFELPTLPVDDVTACINHLLAQGLIAPCDRS